MFYLSLNGPMDGRLNYPNYQSFPNTQPIKKTELTKHTSAKEQTMSRSEMRYAVEVEAEGADRREHRRHDMESQGIAVERWDGKRRVGKPLGKIMDISAGGVRVRTEAGP